MTQLSAASNIHLSAFEEELLQNAHANYPRIIVEKEFSGGYSDARVFLILPLRANGKDARVVSKIGMAAELQREKTNYDNFAGPALPFTAAQIRSFYQQGDRAAVTYVFTGGEALGETISLEDYYHTRSAEDINKTLNVLLDQTLGAAWYGQSQPYQCLFQAEYGRHLLPSEELRKIVSAIHPRLSAVDEKHVQVPGVSATYPNPLVLYPKLLDQTLDGRRSFVHGDLHIRNVLVDETGKGWLIDFAKVKERHNLFDFIKLETYIRLMALAEVAGAFSLSEYAQFEQALNSATLGQALTPPASPELIKAWLVIQNIRQIARNYIAPKPDFNKEYFPALFLYALSMLKYFPVNGPAATQLMYMTTCVLGKFIVEPAKTPTKSNLISTVTHPKETSNEETKKMAKTKNSGNGGISIGGNATDSVIINGDHNKVNKKTQNINTDGGAYINGNVNGGVIGRDNINVDNSIHTTNNNTGASVDEIVKAFALIEARARQEKDTTKKEDTLEAIEKLKAEAVRGDQAEEVRVQRWLSFLAETSIDVWEVAVTTLSNPVLGLGTAFKKIAQYAKDEREKRNRS